MEPETPRKSFWTTLPGVLTGLAAVIGASVGLAALFVNSDGGSTTTTTTADTTTTTADTTTTTTAPPSALPIPLRLELGGGFQRGFFTPKGFIVTTNTSLLDGSLEAVWTADGVEHRGAVEVVDRGSINRQIALLEVVGVTPPVVQYPIRGAGSLRVGEEVEAYLGPGLRTPGNVVETDAVIENFGTEVGSVTVRDILRTTDISGVGDAGAPVLDADGSLVAMILGSNANTVSVQIEIIRAEFSQAF